MTWLGGTVMAEESGVQWTEEGWVASVVPDLLGTIVQLRRETETVGADLAGFRRGLAGLRRMLSDVGQEGTGAVAGVAQSIKRAVEDLAALREAMGDRIAELTASVRGGRAEWKADLSKAVPSNDSRMPPGGGASGKGEGATGGGKADAPSKADLPVAGRRELLDKVGDHQPGMDPDELFRPAAQAPDGIIVPGKPIRQSAPAPIELGYRPPDERRRPEPGGRGEILLHDPEHAHLDLEHPPIPEVVKGALPAGIGDLLKEFVGAVRGQAHSEVTGPAVRPGTDGLAGGRPLADALGLDSLGDEARAALGEVSEAVQAFVSGLEEKLAAGQSRLGAALFEGFVERLRDRLESELRRG